MPAQRVISALEKIIEWRDKSVVLRCDNRPEYISQTLVEWANKKKITLMYIQFGKPTQNGLAEQFNRAARNEWLDLHEFTIIAHK